MDDRPLRAGVLEEPERPKMVEGERQHLRVLIANERRDRLELLAQVVAGLGHDAVSYTHLTLPTTERV